MTFGVWTGLGMPVAPFFLGAGISRGYLLHAPDVWALLLAMLALLVYIVAWHTGWPVFMVWVVNMVLLAWKFRRQLVPPVRFRPLRR